MTNMLNIFLYVSFATIKIFTSYDIKNRYNTVQYNAMQCNAMQCNTIQYNTIQYNTIQYNICCKVKNVLENTLNYSGKDSIKGSSISIMVPLEVLVEQKNVRKENRKVL